MELSDKNVPVGVQIVSNTYDDLNAFRVAYALSKVIAPLRRFKREKCVCIKFIQQMDKFIAYFIQLNRNKKTSKPYEIKMLRSFCIARR